MKNDVLEKFQGKDFIEQYTEIVSDLCIYKGKGTDVGFLLYSSRALAEEVGELQGHIAKSWRDEDAELSLDRKEKIIAELGDIFFDSIACCVDLGISPKDVILWNVEKLWDRLERDVISGDGDYR